MDPGDHDDSQRRFARISEAFDRVWQRADASRSETHFVFAGQPVRIRIVGHALAERVEAPLAHLRSGAATAPKLTIDLWDTHECGVQVADPARHASGQRWTVGDGIFAASRDGRFVSHQMHGSIAWLDRRAHQLSGWFADGRDLSLHQRGKPLQMLLALWASDRGLQAVHAGLVARAGRGVLIPGPSGAGKSTTALSCLDAGYTYLGDDWACLTAPGDAPCVGYGLYSSAFLAPQHAERFPWLRPHMIGADDPSEEKSVVLLSHAYPAYLGDSATVAALVLPRIVDQVETRVDSASKRDALLMLAPSAVFSMRPRGGREAVERLAALVDQVPAYWLEIGRDLNDIPKRVDRILADVVVRR